MLLKMKAEEHNVAQKLIAQQQTLKQSPPMIWLTLLLKGWRREIFGNDALLLKSGKLGLSINNTALKLPKIHNIFIQNLKRPREAYWLKYS